MKNYVVNDNGTLILRTVSGFVPENSVGLLPPGEDVRWMELVDGQLQVNFALKTSIQAQDNVDNQNKNKQKSIENAFKSLENQVINDAKTKLFASSSDSAIVNGLELLMMSQFPNRFSSRTPKLKAEVQVIAPDLITVLFNKGDILDTDQKVLDYSNRLLELACDYLYFRHKQKDDFRAFIAGLG